MHSPKNNTVGNSEKSSRLAIIGIINFFLSLTSLTTKVTMFTIHQSVFMHCSIGKSK